MFNKRYRLARAWLLFWTLFIGIGAVGGATCMLIKPDGSIMGMDGMLPYFQVLPFADVLFQDFVFSGISLLIVNGISNLSAAVLLFKNKKCGVILGGVFGITLMLWITIQFVIFPFNFMSTSYFVFGALQAITGMFCYVGYEQSRFAFDEKRYKNVGKNGRVLVVFYSRTGYTKKIAYETADKLGADICEIKTTEKTDGNLGFWWCGRFGMLKRAMPLEKIEADVCSYDKVVICSPVWVFGIAAPIRGFMQTYAGKLKSVEYVFLHFMRASFSGLADEADNILKVKRESFKSYSSHYGKIKEIK